SRRTRHLATIAPNIVNASLIRYARQRRWMGTSPWNGRFGGRRGPLRKCRLALQPRAGGAARRQLPARAALIPVPDRAVGRRKVIAAAHAVSCAETHARADQPVRP